MMMKPIGVKYLILAFSMFFFPDWINVVSGQIRTAKKEIIPEGEGKRVAVIVGIDSSQEGRLTIIRNHEADLRKLGGLLKNKYDFQQVLTFYNSEATSRNIYRLYEDLSKTITRDDALFVYFSGDFVSQFGGGKKNIRGIANIGTESVAQVESEERVYFIPYDAQPGQPYTYIDLGEIFNLLFRLPANRILFVINDCIYLPAAYEKYFYNASVQNKVKGSTLLSYQCKNAWDLNQSLDLISNSFIASLQDPDTKGTYSFNTVDLSRMLEERLSGEGMGVLHVKVNDGFVFNLKRDNVDASIVANLQRGNDESVRLQAIDALVKFVNGASKNSKMKITAEAAVNHLIPIAENESESPAIRMKAMDALAKMEYDNSLSSLNEILRESKDITVREAAFNAISRFPTTQSVPYFRQALNYPASDIRIRAIQALAFLPDTVSNTAIIQLAIEDDEEEVQLAALEVLPLFESLTNDQISELKKLLSNTGNLVILKGAINTLSKLKIEGIEEQLATLLNNRGVDVREAAAYALASLKDTITDENIEKQLTEILINDAEPKVREAAAFALGYAQGSRSARELLNKAKFQKEITSVRVTSIYSLGHRKSHELLQRNTMDELFKDENYQIRLALAEALGEIGEEAGLDRLYRATKDENSQVRIASEKSIKQIKSKLEESKQANYVITGLKDSVYTVRRDALNQLAILNASYLVPYAIPLLGDDEYTVRETAIRVLSRFTDEESVKLYTEALWDKNPRGQFLIRVGAARIFSNTEDEFYVSVLFRALRDRNSTVRASVALALGRMELPVVIDSLLQILATDNFDVRRAAAEGLAMQCILKAKSNILQAHELAEKVYNACVLHLGEKDPWTTWFDIVSFQKESNNEEVTLQVVNKSQPANSAESSYLVLEHEESFQCIVKNNSDKELFISLIDLSVNNKMNVLQAGYVGAHDVMTIPLKAFIPKGNDLSLDVFKIIVSSTRFDLQQLLDVMMKNDKGQFYSTYMRFGELINSSIENIQKGAPDWHTLEAYVEVRPQSGQSNPVNAK